MSKNEETGKVLRKIMTKIAQALIITSCFLLSGCFLNYDLTGKTRKQGNLLSEKKVASLHAGMSKERVAGIMGTSLISPTFRLSRWDYINTYQEANKPIRVKTVVLYFKGNQLAKIEKQEKKLPRR
jgi:outer membrane protein assembly factor BamE